MLSLTEQIHQGEERLAQARIAKNSKDEALQLLNLGALLPKVGEQQRALECDDQALAIFRRLKLEVSEASTLQNIGGTYSDSGERQKALEYYDEALQIRRKIGDRNGEGETLNSIGVAYEGLGQPQKALEYYNQALPIRRKVGDRRGEALTLNNIGLVYSHLPQRQTAMEYYNQALTIRRQFGDRAGEATTLNDIGMAYSGLRQKQTALEYLDEALLIRREVGDSKGEALTLRNIGSVYSSLGQRQKALEYYDEALQIRRKVGDRRGEASTLQSLGLAYGNLGQDQKALECFNEALRIHTEVHNRAGEAATLHSIGWVYGNLGQLEKAFRYYNEAIPIWREVGNRGGEARALSNMSTGYSHTGQSGKALEFAYKALGIWREIGDRDGESLTLHTIGWIYRDLGQNQKALEYFSEALPIDYQLGNEENEAYTLRGLGEAYDSLGEKEKALATEVAALSVAKVIEEPDLEGEIDSSLMAYWQGQNHPEVAILFGIDAVNQFQQIRKNISEMDTDLQASFTNSKSATYRELAELLVQTDHLGEAERVLDLLKEEELKEVVRGRADDPTAKAKPLPLTTAQQKAQNDLAAPEQTAVALTGLSMEYARLLAKPTRTAEEAAQLKTLDARIEADNGEVSALFRSTIYPELEQKVGKRNANALLSKEKSEVSGLQNTLAALSPRVMGIRLLLGEKHAYAIIVTAQAREKFELKATPAELRSKVLQVRDDLRSASSNPKPHLLELYAMVVAPMADQLMAIEQLPGEQNRVPTLLWSLDGVLRYLPMAALYDGTHYMAERFNNVLFTPESYGHMTAPTGTNVTKLRALAMGLSKSYGGLPALPGVMPELEAVVHDPAVPTSHGPMDGKLLPNEQFTLTALKTQLGAAQSFPVVHIASHFVIETGTNKEPYLMLGGETLGGDEGYPLTLSKLENSSISFHGTQLLTLSACSTAKGDAAKNGLEMDSLGMIAQQKDAEAVLATLWDVNDASTKMLMSDFYSRWVKLPRDGKAEALRQAQLDFLNGTSPASSDSGIVGGFQVSRESRSTSNKAAYSHPFYWAPFVLIGNFQ